jgi:hypothetical protein
MENKDKFAVAKKHGKKQAKGAREHKKLNWQFNKNGEKQ